MRRMAWGAVLLACALVAQAGEPTVLAYPASALIDVDTTGKAHVVTLATRSGQNGAPRAAVSELIEPRLRERIESWQFVPATRDGTAVPSRTHLSINLRAMDDGRGGLSVQVVSASTGASLREHPLREVVGAIAGPGMFLIADLRYGADGRVDDVDVTDQRIFSGGQFVPYADRSFRRIVEKALKRWTFEPEIVAGRAIEGHGRLPIRMCLSDACIAAPVDTGEADEFASADPAVRLRDDVAGTTL